jgi:hypothetical protein
MNAKGKHASVFFEAYAGDGFSAAIVVKAQSTSALALSRLAASGKASRFSMPYGGTLAFHPAARVREITEERYRELIAETKGLD